LDEIRVLGRSPSGLSSGDTHECPVRQQTEVEALMPRMKSVVLALVAVFALCMAISDVAVATSSPYFVGCDKVGVGLGGYPSSACVGEVRKDAWARALFVPNKGLSLCLSVGVLQFSQATCMGAAGASYALFGHLAPKATISGGKYTFKGKVLATTTKVACTSTTAKEPKIEGGEPGKVLVTAIEYAGCVVEEPKKCEVNTPGKVAGTVATKAVSAELVEDAKMEKVETLLSPKEGVTYVELELKNKGSETCALKAVKAKVEGSSLAENLPANEITEKATLKSEPANREYRNSKGETKTAGMTIAEETFTIAGEATLEVTAEGGKVKNGETGEEVAVEGGKVSIGEEK
jgi:hypothetical protein